MCRRSVVCLSVCLSVCVSVSAKPVEMPRLALTRETVIQMGWGTFWRQLTNTTERSKTAAMRAVATTDLLYRYLFSYIIIYTSKYIFYAASLCSESDLFLTVEFHVRSAGW